MKNSFDKSHLFEMSRNKCCSQYNLKDSPNKLSQKCVHFPDDAVPFENDAYRPSLFFSFCFRFYLCRSITSTDFPVYRLYVRISTV